MKKKYLLLAIGASAFMTILYTWLQIPTPGRIPKKYQGLYAELKQKLDQFDQQSNSQRDGKQFATTFGAELIIANGNRGTALLEEENYQYIMLYLDRLQELNVQGVKVTIGYPLLVSNFVDSDKYLDFYQKLAHEIMEKRKMKLLVQTAALFTESEFTSLPTREYYQNLTLEKYIQGKREQVEKIITHIQPNYLTVETEPDTMANNTGLIELNNPKIFRMVVEGQLNKLDRRQTLIGAGVGTWSDQQFIKELVQIHKLDYLDLHIYPIVNDYLQRLIDYIDLAKSYNKRVVVGEFWLYKASEQEINRGVAVAKIFGRDTFGFWQPLDQKFLAILVKLAHDKQIEFISPFWTNYFFAYLGYGFRTKYRSPGALLKMTNKQAAKNYISGQFSKTGLQYQALIIQSGIN